MAKETTTKALKGKLNMAGMKLVEKDKEGERTYNLNALLQKYDGELVELTLKIVKPLAGGDDA